MSPWTSLLGGEFFTTIVEMIETPLPLDSHALEFVLGEIVQQWPQLALQSDMCT